MLRWQKAARATQGKTFEALQWAQDLTTWYNAKYPGVQMQVFLEQYGAAGMIHWVMDFPDAATMENVLGVVFSDEEFRARVSQSEGLLGSSQDTVMKLL